MFFSLFLQPFIVGGLTLVGHLIHRKRKRDCAETFVADSSSLPLDLPGWGRLNSDEGRLRIDRSSLGVLGSLAAFAVGYCAVCFVSVFVMFFFLGSYGQVNPGPSVMAFAVALVGGIVGVFLGRSRRFRKARLAIDTRSRLLVVESVVRPVRIDFDRIGHWGLTSVNIPLDDDGGSAPLLGVVSEDGIFHPVHYYEGDGDDESVAMRTGLVLAGITGHSLRRVVPPEFLRPIETSDFKGMKAAHKDAHRRKKELSAFS